MSGSRSARPSQIGRADRPWRIWAPRLQATDILVLCHNHSVDSALTDYTQYYTSNYSTEKVKNTSVHESPQMVKKRLERICGGT